MSHPRGGRRRLSGRDREILRHIDEGRTTEEIAVQMARSKWTIRDAIRRMCRELDAPMRDLPRAARDAGKL
jgi:DNA-binding CsgD family transcriptional regulator